MAGERSLNVNRQELVDKYGYDTKYAMHIIRLLFECDELLSTGRLLFPSNRADYLQHIRRGEYTQDKIVSKANNLIEVIEKYATDGTYKALSSQIDRQLVSRTVADVYREYWRKWKI